MNSYIRTNTNININYQPHRLVNSIYNTFNQQFLTLNKQNEKKDKVDTLENIFKILFNNHDYESLKNIIPLMDLDSRDKFIVEAVVDVYSKWDIYDYDNMKRMSFKEYPKILEPIIQGYEENLKTLKKILSNHNDYRLIIDLINNANRRNEEAKYNDAIMQLYRAMELISHVKLLKNYRIDSTDVDLNRLIELEIDSNYINYLQKFANNHNIISLHLREQYCLLKMLNDPLGKYFYKNHDMFLEIIKMRHSSIMVHGTTYINSLQYQQFEYLVKELTTKLNKVIKKYIKLTEFPKFDLDK